LTFKKLQILASIILSSGVSVNLSRGVSRSTQLRPGNRVVVEEQHIETHNTDWHIHVRTTSALKTINRHSDDQYHSLQVLR